MTNNSVLLLISDRPEDQTFAAEVAIGAGLSLQTVADVKQAVQIIANDGAKVIFADVGSKAKYDQFELAIQESVGIFSDKVDSNFIHFISSEDLSKSIYLVQSPLFGHFVIRGKSDPKLAGEMYGRMVKTTLLQKAFGLQNLLKSGTKIQTVPIKMSTQKIDAVEAVRNYLAAAKFPNRISVLIANAVDEILMNAMFDAPMDDAGRHTLASTARSTKLNLEGKNQVEMQVGFDGRYVGITAVDNFGSLDRAKLLSHFSKSYADERLKLGLGVVNAGIGLATIFRNGGSFFFCSEAGVRTEVSVLFQKLDSYKDFKSQFRFIATQFYF